jgi:hypothetical protein
VFQLTRRTVATVLLTTLVAVALVTPSGASAKSQKVSINVAGGVKGTTLSGKISGSLGSGTMSGKLVIPDTQQVWTFKGDTLKVTGHGESGAANDAYGTWKITGGTGKYKGASGGGKFTGKQSTGKFAYTGSIKT